MQYKYALERPDYSDLASGRVFYSLPGHPAFPVRLASEIFQRCLAIRAADHLSSPCILYDPCCGTAYNLSVLAYLHGEHLTGVIGSDADGKAVALAGRNLGLLNPAGIENRIAEIAGMIGRFDKASHREALASAQILQKRISSTGRAQPLNVSAFQASALDADGMAGGLAGRKADIVLTDVPYGRASNWDDAKGHLGSGDFIQAMLEALKGVLHGGSVVAIASNKTQKAVHAEFRRIEQLQAGKRRITLLRLA